MHWCYSQSTNKTAYGKPQYHELVSVDIGQATEAKLLSVTADIQQLSLYGPG